MADKEKKTTLLLWCDLETTGLDQEAYRANILEGSFILTSEYLETEYWTRTAAFPDVYQLPDLEHIDPKVDEMHTKNGLWNACRASKICFEDFADLIQAKITTEIPSGTGITGDVDIKLAGSSIHFDRDWIKEFAPGLASKFIYRLLDCSAYYPILDRLGMMPERDRNHRAESDIRRSMECYRRILSLRPVHQA